MAGICQSIFRIPCLCSAELLKEFQSVFLLMDDSKQRLFIAAVKIIIFSIFP